MAYWLFKSEPDAWSWEQQKAKGAEGEEWTGVRNYQARNFMLKEMKPGDPVLFYHSNCAQPGIAGLAEVASEPYPDPTQFDRKSDYHDPGSKPEEPRWWLVDVRFVRKLARVITLEELKAQADALGEFALLRRGNRLSVLPVSKAQFRHILSLE